MKKKAIIVSAASLAMAAMPVAGVFAVTYDNPVVDQVQVTVSEVCNMTSSVTPSESGGPNGTYSKTVTPGTMIGGSEGQAWGGTPSTMTYSCNNAGGWKVTAQGVAGVGDSTAQTSLVGSVGGEIATGTVVKDAPESKWAFRVSGTGAVSEYTNFSAVPGTSTIVASSDAQGTPVYEGTLTPYYEVWVSSTQKSDTYTGYVKYILSAPL